MPQRTRHEKEQAASRRLREMQESTLVKREFEFSLSQAQAPKSEAEPEKKNDKSLQLAPTSLLVRDLVKTLLLATLIFSLELVLYSVWFK